MRTAVLIRLTRRPAAFTLLQTSSPVLLCTHADESAVNGQACWLARSRAHVQGACIVNARTCCTPSNIFWRQGVLGRRARCRKEASGCRRHVVWCIISGTNRMCLVDSTVILGGATTCTHQKAAWLPVICCPGSRSVLVALSLAYLLRLANRSVCMTLSILASHRSLPPRSRRSTQARPTMTCFKPSSRCAGGQWCSKCAGRS